MQIRQIALAPAGCQYWHKQVIGTSKSKFVFCTTLAVYIGSTEPYAIEQIISNPDQSLTCIEICPLEQSLLATGTTNSKIIIWNIEEEKTRAEISLPSVPISLHWCPKKKGLMYVLMKNHDFKSINLEEKNISLINSFVNLQPIFMEIQPSNPDIFAFACKEGSLVFYHIQTKVVTEVKCPVKSDIENIAWNFENYLLVSYGDGSLKLFESGKEMESFSFERQGTGISCISLIYNSSGEFLTGCERIASIRLWNVSQKTPKSTIKIGINGLRGICPFSEKSNLFLTTFANGAVGIFNLNTKKIEFRTEPGHSETIFNISIKPNNCNIVGTCSYDGYFKAWDMVTMKEIVSINHTLKLGDPDLESKSGILYCFAWSP